MFRSCEDISRLTLELLKGYRNYKMLETGSHVYKLCRIFPKYFKMKIKTKLEKAIRQRGLLDHLGDLFFCSMHWTDHVER
jgi:hypothetical protein